jgi:hypothetical protein
VNSIGLYQEERGERQCVITGKYDEAICFKKKTQYLKYITNQENQILHQLGGELQNKENLNYKLQK